MTSRNWDNTLRKYPWLLPMGIGILFIVVEYIHHLDSPQPAYKHPMFWVEALLFAVIIPIFTSQVFGRMMQATTEREIISKALNSQLFFTSTVVGATEWDEVLDKIIHFPGSILPVSRSFLHIYDIENNKYILAAACDDGTPTSEEIDPVIPMAAYSSDGYIPIDELTEPLFKLSTHCPEFDRYRLALTYDGFTIAYLHIDIPTSSRISTDQLKLISRLGPEMALVLENARVHKVPHINDNLLIQERKNIARQLHDTLGQNISYLRLKLDLLNEQAPLVGIGDIQTELERMLSIATEAHDQIRSTLSDLLPFRIDSIDKSFQSLAESIGKRSAFEVRFTNAGKPKTLSAYMARQVWFIYRESLNNIEKHAKTDVVDINLEWTEKQLTISIIDHGVGFKPKDAQKSNKYGLWIMKDRAASINAELQIESIPDQGTKISLLVPFS